MPPRFMERINRQSDTLKTVFGDSREPPPYASTRSSVASSASASSAYSSIRPSKPAVTPPPRYNHLAPQRRSLDHVAIPKDSLVLVTGANSFLGMHIVDQLLSYGYRVRGAVRDVEKATSTTKYFTDRYGADRYTATIVPNMAAEGAYIAAVQGCAGIVHVASVTSMSPNPDEVITPSIAGAVNVLEAAAGESGVARFVHTSSVAAAISHDREQRYEISTHTWNMTDFNLAWAEPPYEDDRILAVRGSAKMQAEAAVWRWVEVNKPKFTLNTVLPDIIWGKFLDPDNQSYPLSIEILRTIFNGNIPDYPAAHFVDVQDAALLHVAALLLPELKGQRIFAVRTPWNVESLVQLMRKLYPKKRISGNKARSDTDQTLFREVDKAEGILRKMDKKSWTEIETSMGESCAAFR